MPTCERQLVTQPPPYGDLHQQPTRYCLQRCLWLPSHSTHTRKQQSDMDTCRQLGIWTPADSLAHDQDWAEGLTCCLGSHCDIKGCAANNAAVAAAVATHGQVTVVWSCETQTRTTSAQICATKGSTADQLKTCRVLLGPAQAAARNQRPAVNLV